MLFHVSGEAGAMETPEFRQVCLDGWALKNGIGVSGDCSWKTSLLGLQN